MDLKEITEGERKMKVADLFEAIRMGDTEAHELVLETLKGQGIFHPLFTTILENFDGIDINKAASLMYLYNQIENPMQGVTKVTLDYYDKAAAISQDKIDFQKVTQVQKNRILADINELVVTMMVDDCAWSYFGRERARSILDLLKDSHYGPLLFQDLLKFAADENRKFFAPPQILNLLLQISKDIFGNESVVFTNLNSGEILKKFYDGGGSLAEYQINYSITSLDRVDEYDMSVFPDKTELQRIIKPEFRDGSILSIGGSIGLEALRTFKFKNPLLGPVMVVDPLGYEDALKKTLILEHEYRFKDGDPRLSHQLIEEKLKVVPGGLLFLKDKVPITYSQITKRLNETETPFASSKEKRQRILKSFSERPVKIIFDQRASGIYLEGQKQLDSIKNSLRMLSQGGAYFFTRGYADKLIVDQVIEISPQTGKVTLRHFHTTEPYTYVNTNILASITGTGLATMFYRYPYKIIDPYDDPTLFNNLMRNYENYLLKNARESTFLKLSESLGLGRKILYTFIGFMEKVAGNIELLGNIDNLAKEFYLTIKETSDIFFPYVLSGEDSLGLRNSIYVTEEWCYKTIKKLLQKWQITNQLINDRHAEITAKIVSQKKEREARLTFFVRITQNFKDKFAFEYYSCSVYNFTDIILGVLFSTYNINYPITLKVRDDGKLLIPKGYLWPKEVYKLIHRAIFKKIVAIKNKYQYNWEDFDSDSIHDTLREGAIKSHEQFGYNLENFESVSGLDLLPDTVALFVRALKKCPDSNWGKWISYFDKALGTKSHQAAD